MIILWILGFILFGAAYEAGAMVPSEKEAFREFMKDGAVPASYEPFCAPIYAIDTSLPIISFGQRDKWHPVGAGKDIKVPEHGIEKTFDAVVCQASFTRGWAERTPLLIACFKWLRWIYLATGWFLTTMFVAGVSGLVGRD